MTVSEKCVVFISFGFAISDSAPRPVMRSRESSL